MKNLTAFPGQKKNSIPTSMKKNGKEMQGLSSPKNSMMQERKEKLRVERKVEQRELSKEKSKGKIKLIEILSGDY